jgi:excisionase family DNA binding protein
MTKLITTSEAAKALGVHPDTIKNWIKKGTLIAHNTPSGYLIPEDEINFIREILGTSKWGMWKHEVHQLGIPRYYQMCVNNQYEEVTKELGLSDIPKNVRECLTIVSRNLRGRQRQKIFKR